MYIYTYIRSRQFLRLRNQTEGKKKERKRCVLYQNPSREKKGARKRGKKRPSNSTKKNECLSVFINVAVCIKFGICNDGVREGEREERRKKKVTAV